MLRKCAPASGTVKAPFAKADAFAVGPETASASIAAARARPGMAARPERVRLWEIGHGYCCSIVGTCLSHDDLLRIAAKENVGLDADITDYHVHGFFVQQSSEDGPLARRLEKVMNTRFAGAIRKVARGRGHDELSAIWNDMVNSGHVAAAYWAFLSHSHVPAELRDRIFGEVHMLSHLMGGSSRKIIGVAVELQNRIDALEAARERTARSTREALEERDRRIRELESRLAEGHVRPATGSAAAGQDSSGRARRVERLLIKRERALIAARVRARELEAELDRLSARLHRSRADRRASAEVRIEPHALPGALGDLAGRQILYLGGRTGSMAKLREVARERNVTLLHHDGGAEDNDHRLDDLVSRCDAVVYPVNCVSHSACLRAKKLCKRFDKSFVPIRGAGGETFSRALSEIFGVLAGR